MFSLIEPKTLHLQLELTQHENKRTFKFEIKFSIFLFHLKLFYFFFSQIFLFLPHFPRVKNTFHLSEIMNLKIG